MIVRGFKLQINQIHSGKRSCYKHQFHTGVIQRHVSGNQVQVSRYVHNSKQNLTFARYTLKRNGCCNRKSLKRTDKIRLISFVYTEGVNVI